MASQRRRSLRQHPFVGLMVLGLALTTIANLVFADWLGAATSGGLTALLWWAHRP
jgi:hypothetical protein